MKRQNRNCVFIKIWVVFSTLVKYYVGNTGVKIYFLILMQWYVFIIVVSWLNFTSVVMNGMESLFKIQITDWYWLGRSQVHSDFSTPYSWNHNRYLWNIYLKWWFLKFFSLFVFIILFGHQKKMLSYLSIKYIYALNL